MKINKNHSLIFKMEMSGAPHKLKTCGFNIWPLVRADAHFSEVGNGSENYCQAPLLSRLLRQLNLLRNSMRFLRKIQRPSVRPILFIYESEYQEYIQEFRERFKGSLKDVNWLNINSEGGGMAFEVNEDCLGYGRELAVRYSRRAILWSLLRVAHPRRGPTVLGKDYESQARYVHHFSVFFESILKDMRPRSVVQICYYSLNGFSLTLAAHRQNITCVDYQHGAQNDSHLMYASWLLPPSAGYELLPDLFWTWGRPSQQRIESWALRTKKHSAFIGGHSGALLRMKSDVAPRKPSGEKKVMLVSLQAEKFFPHWLLTVIPKISDRYCFVFRPHPRNPVSKCLAERLGELSMVSLEHAASVDKYSAVLGCDVHVTAFSSLGVEANALGRTTIYVHEMARLGLGKYLDDTSLLLATTELEFLRALEISETNCVKTNNYIAGPEEVAISPQLPLIENTALS